MKKCPKCGETDTGKFGISRGRKDGMQTYCKPCLKIWRDDHRSKPEVQIQRLEYGAEYRNRPEVQIRRLKYGAEYRKRPYVIEAEKKRHQQPKVKIENLKRVKRDRKDNPVVYSARLAVQHAVKNGKLPRVSTLKCQEQGEHCRGMAQEYHHIDYTKENWLNVIPLCTSCHRFIHRRLSK